MMYNIFNYSTKEELEERLTELEEAIKADENDSCLTEEQLEITEFLAQVNLKEDESYYSESAANDYAEELVFEKLSSCREVVFEELSSCCSWLWDYIDKDAAAASIMVDSFRQEQFNGETIYIK